MDTDINTDRKHEGLVREKLASDDRLRCEKRLVADKADQYDKAADDHSRETLVGPAIGGRTGKREGEQDQGESEA